MDPKADTQQQQVYSEFIDDEVVKVHGGSLVGQSAWNGRESGISPWWGLWQREIKQWEWGLPYL